LIVLECSRADLLLDTVRSRCVTVRLGSLSADDTRQVLAAHGLDGSAATDLARWAEGSPGRALALAREGAPAVLALLAAVLAGELDPLAACGRLLELPGEFNGQTPAAQTRARARAALDLLGEVLRDGLRACAGVPIAELAHGELVAAAPRPESAWCSALNEVLALRGEVELNLSPQGILDRALLALARRAEKDSRCET
jgi:DNA polymerase-3 subunit delta'